MKSLLSNQQFLLIAFGLFAFTTLMFNDGALFDEDEAAYAGFAKTMNDTGDWANPSFEWSDMHRKTPLHFWAIAVSFKIMGPTEYALRLPGSIAVLLTVFFLYYFGKRLWGDLAATGAALVLASSLFVPLLAKNAVTDAELMLFETLAGMALLLAIREPSWKWNLLLWGSVALGLLEKGPPILIFAGGMWLFLMIFHPLRKNLVHTHPWFFLPLAMLPIFWWGWISWHKDNGAFLQFLWDWYVVKRVEGSVLGQTGLPGYHLLVMLVSFLPWLTFFPSALAAHVNGVRRKGQVDIELAAWLFFGWIFYEIMTSKLPAYSIAAQPALALLIARQALASGENGYKWVIWDRAMVVIGLILTFGLAIAILVFANNYLGGQSTLGRAVPPALIAWVCSFFAAVGVYMNGPIKHKIISGAMAIGGIGTMFLLWLSIAPLVDQSPIKGTKHTVFTARTESNDQTSAILLLRDSRMKNPSLAFYTKVAFKNTLITDDSSVALARFESPEPVVLITDSLYRAELSAALLAKGRSWSGEKRVEWWDTDHQLERKYFYILRN